MKNWRVSLGARYLTQNISQFLVWAPFANQLELEIMTTATTSEIISMEKMDSGYYALDLTGVSPGTNYFYRFDCLNRRPDPASRYQPLGVFGPSQIIAADFPWTDQDWRGIKLEDYIIYELHVGLYTQEGTFAAIIPYLKELKQLGITAIELMPVAQFSGVRNWGYDDVFPYAVQNSYGGPQGLKLLVNACHENGLAVILDVVYNHLGPEGNYFADFGPYFTEKYKTPWGRALNFDDAGSDQVRRYFIENALHWMLEYHIDALRLDAIQNIMDYSAQHFLRELTEACNRLSAELNTKFYLIAESNLNDIRVIAPESKGGYGIHAQWNDEFHHALYALLTGERKTYYVDFGELQHILKAYQEGFVYSGQYSSFRRRNFGSSSKEISPKQLVIFSQNHDQVGNYGSGNRLGKLLSWQQLKLIAALTLLSPYIPLIFMGEEYAETAPFHFFVDFMDKELLAQVQKGRIEEMLELGLEQPVYNVQDESIFEQCKLQHNLKHKKENKALWDFYRTLLQLRKSNSALADLTKAGMVVLGDAVQKTMLVKRVAEDNEVLLIFNFNDQASSVKSIIPPGKWHRILTTQDNAESLNITEASVLEMPAFAFMLFVRQI